MLNFKDFLDFLSVEQDILFPVHVALPLPMWKEFTYLAPKTLPIGSVVQVSFGSRMLWGVAWKKVPPCTGKIKTIVAIHPFLKLSNALIEFVQSMACYIICPVGLIVKMIVPPAIDYAENHLFQAAQDALPVYNDPPLDKNYVGTIRQWATLQDMSLVATRKLIRSGLLISVLVQREKPLYHAIDTVQKTSEIGVSTKEPLVLSASQEIALQSIMIHVHKALPIVLEGVTGSGKTEVILALCQSIWAKGQQVLVLLPEIMLSYPWLQRVEKYFKVPVTLWHSAMSPRLRQEGFENIVMGKSLLIIGARSALFLPYAQLGLIVVDEEHEAAYKQTDSVFYHGRDMAVLRGKKEGIPVVLASATPSMETCWNIKTQRYAHVRLMHRYGVAQFPSFSCIDMRPHPPKENAWISPELHKAIQETLDKGEQSLLFLNRRGYACLWMCYRCGYRASCAYCSAWLTVHEQPPQLLCHYCGYHIPTPTQCPGCGDDQGILWMGPGIERIAKEAKRLFPAARIVLLSSDHIASAEQMTQILDQITNREVDILIGTQLIAKGYHFPYLTCIGIVDTDFALADMDFRSSERLFQLLYQVAGRAGRADRPGKVLLQTLQPDYPLFRQLLSYDWDSFVQQEMALRKAQDYPPMKRLTAIILSHKEEWAVQELALKWQKKCSPSAGIKVFGPAPAPLSPLRGRYRWRFLIKAQPTAPLYAFLKEWIYVDSLPRGMRVEIDRDPYSLL